MLRATIVVLSLLAVCAMSSAAEPTKDSLDLVKKRLQEKQAILIDVREQAEWNAGRLEQAILVPLSLLNAGKGFEGLPKDKIIYCHCRAGVRSLRAAEILEKKGFDVRSLPQGFEDLLKAGFPKAKANERQR